ncbi:hypothetical protein QL285_014158 [Trifolium repens]|nr:hypothetical protein QL285_014158 [Trifolium repens]
MLCFTEPDSPTNALFSTASSSLIDYVPAPPPHHHYHRTIQHQPWMYLHLIQRSPSSGSLVTVDEHDVYLDKSFRRLAWSPEHVAAVRVCSR